MTKRGHFRPRRARLLAALVVASLVTGCGAAAPSGPQSNGGAPGRASPGAPTSAARSPGSTPASPTAASAGAAPAGASAGASAGPPKAAAAPGAAARLVAQTAGWRLPHPMSREAALAVGGRIVVLGGLAPTGESLASVLRVDPATGAVVSAGRLARATHDAAAALFTGAAHVFGGGTTGSTAAIQAIDAAPRSGPDVQAGRIVGQLPAPRSDLAAVVEGSTTFLVGGWDGSRLLPAILATSDGVHIRMAGELAVPVRYAATAAAGGSIWIFGGQGAGGDTSAIQRFDPASGRASVVGHLPVAIAGASAVMLGGAIFVAGGSVAGHASDAIWRFDPATGRVTGAGRLPYAVAYAAVVTVGNVAYLLGGESASLLDSVVELRAAAP